jgi:hypothetical protein
MPLGIQICGTRQFMATVFHIAQGFLGTIYTRCSANAPCYAYVVSRQKRRSIMAVILAQT